MDVYSADEAFVTGTFAGLVPVTCIDGRVIGNDEGANQQVGTGDNRGPMVKRLQKLYTQLLDEECHLD